ncbi:hypothetical protein L7F22_038003, partial [Adiantum nelumboides]|nr:hypothetical protein [Adiantum nelumboides]
ARIREILKCAGLAPENLSQSAVSSAQSLANNAHLLNIKDVEAVLSRVGYTPEINHGVLMQMVELRKDLERKTKPILETLRSYQDLPPDKALAELAIEDKRREIEAAEKYLEDALQSALNTPSE